MTNIFLEESWAHLHLTKIKAKAGGRYSPQLNVDLPISEVFEAICRTKSFYTSIRTRFGNLCRAFHHVSTKYENQDIERRYKIFAKKTALVIKLLGRVKDYDTKIIPWERIGKEAGKASELAWELTRELRKEKDPIKKYEPAESSGKPRHSDRLEVDIHHIYEAQKELRHFANYSTSIFAQASNHAYLFLSGIAGSGKTHLLCDVVERRIQGGTILPSALLFGEFFVKGNTLWDQITTQLGMEKKYTKQRFLDAINGAGKKAGSRALLIIDALNESRPSGFWKSELLGFYNEIKKYPHISLVVSVRSGFEDEVFPKNARKLFLTQEHHGFQFREWEAVTKFFQAFSLPLPEIPLLMPEFQNPLFLLLFCKAFEDRARHADKDGQRQIFRGHEGATYIFESFVKSVADRIADQFELPGGKNQRGKYVIWNTVIKKVASYMVDQASDRLSEDRLVEIVNQSHPTIDCRLFLQALENNLLLIKVPRYPVVEGEATGFDFRFPFQKFSDHLLGRYIFKKFRASTMTPEAFFSLNTPIGKFINGNRGVIHALSIQCPEWQKGTEFFEVVSHIDLGTLADAFTESLVWRKPSAFKPDKKNLIRFINETVISRNDGETSILNALLSVAPIPNHPLNANYLHRNLFARPLPHRDATWSTFLHQQHGEEGAVDRLVKWGWSDPKKDRINDEAIKLCGIALTWMLTTSNRFLRDKVTKALVSLLTNRLPVVQALIDQFKEVDDPYVLERLMAVAYGCALRNLNDNNGQRKLALWIYDYYFERGNVPVHILTRDFARGVIETAITRGLVHLRQERILPPYGSPLPKTPPTLESLKEKYYPIDISKIKPINREYLGIWSSVMYDAGSLGDFGRYKVNSTLDHWSQRKLGHFSVNRHNLFDKFQKGLSSQELDLWKKTDPFHGISLSSLLERKLRKKEVAPSREKAEKATQELKDYRKEAVQRFKQALSRNKRKYFEKEIEPYLSDNGIIVDPRDKFDTQLAQRWIFNRVIELGWDPKLHGEFDAIVNRNQLDRSGQKAERIGKKYQWIAFHELLGMVADNFEYKGESWSTITVEYGGPWQLTIRDIDPSCLLDGEPKEDEEIPSLSSSWLGYNGWKETFSPAEWLKTAKSLPDPKSLIEVVDKTGVTWLVMEGHFKWQETIPPEQDKYEIPRRTLWYMLKSYLVKKDEKSVVVNWVKKQLLSGRWTPESNDFYMVFLGEYPSSLAFLTRYPGKSNLDDWTVGSEQRKVPAKILVTDKLYVGNESDCSTKDVPHVRVPAKWLVERMNLTQHHMDGRFFDQDGVLIAFDPHVFGKTPMSCLLMRKDKVLKSLNYHECDVFWTLLSEKNMIGGHAVGQPLGWQETSGVYFFNDHERLLGSKNSRFKS